MYHETKWNFQGLHGMCCFVFSFFMVQRKRKQKGLIISERQFTHLVSWDSAQSALWREFNTGWETDSMELNIFSPRCNPVTTKQLDYDFNAVVWNNWFNRAIVDYLAKYVCYMWEAVLLSLHTCLIWLTIVAAVLYLSPLRLCLQFL